MGCYTESSHSLVSSLNVCSGGVRDQRQESTSRTCVAGDQLPDASSLPFRVCFAEKLEEGTKSGLRMQVSLPLGSPSAFTSYLFKVSNVLLQYQTKCTFYVVTIWYCLENNSMNISMCVQCRDFSGHSSLNSYNGMQTEINMRFY